jgi:hypothetical protein
MGPDGPTEAREYSLPEGKLEALVELLARDDVPILIERREGEIIVHATPAQHRVFAAFLRMIHPDGGQPAEEPGFIGALPRNRPPATTLNNRAQIQEQLRRSAQELQRTRRDAEREAENVRRRAERAAEQADRFADRAEEIRDRAEAARAETERTSLVEAARAMLTRADASRAEAESLEHQAEAIEARLEELEAAAEALEEQIAGLQEGLDEEEVLNSLGVLAIPELDLLGPVHVPPADEPVLAPGPTDDAPPAPPAEAPPASTPATPPKP